MQKSDLIEIAEIVTVALICPFALFLPQFNTIYKKENHDEQMETIQSEPTGK